MLLILFVTDGAALIYTSVKKDRNCDLVLDYLQHVLYDIEFLVKAQVIEKDSIFVPIGWDSMAKIEVQLMRNVMNYSVSANHFCIG